MPWLRGTSDMNKRLAFLQAFLIIFKNCLGQAVCTTLPASRTLNVDLCNNTQNHMPLRIWPSVGEPG